MTARYKAHGTYLQGESTVFDFTEAAETETKRYIYVENISFVSAGTAQRGYESEHMIDASPYTTWHTKWGEVAQDKKMCIRDRYMNEWYTTDPAYTNVTVPVYTIQKPRSDKDNMVILYCAEGYTKSQQKLFVEDVKRLWGEVLKIEPYRSMADRFNVYALCTPSEDTFMGDSTFFNATKKTIAGTRGPWRNHVLEQMCIRDRLHRLYLSVAGQL